MKKLKIEHDENFIRFDFVEAGFAFLAHPYALDLAFTLHIPGIRGTMSQIVYPNNHDFLRRVEVHKHDEDVQFCLFDIQNAKYLSEIRLTDKSRIKLANKILHLHEIL